MDHHDFSEQSDHFNDLPDQFDQESTSDDHLIEPALSELDSTSDDIIDHDPGLSLEEPHPSGDFSTVNSSNSYEFSADFDLDDIRQDLPNMDTPPIEAFSFGSDQSFDEFDSDSTAELFATIDIDHTQVPEPVDGLPWVDLSLIGEDSPQNTEPSPVYSQMVTASLAELRADLALASADPIDKLSHTDDPAVSALAQRWLR